MIPDLPVQSARLAALFHRRWAVPVLASLQRAGGGAKLATLCHRLDAAPGPVRASVGHLIAMGLAARPEGLGHPLRPEVVLTGSGAQLADAADRLVSWSTRREAQDVISKKWPMSIVWAVGAGEDRFGGIRAGIPRLSDRALSQALRSLRDHALIDRRLVDGSPPSSAYRLTRSGSSLIPHLRELVAGAA